MIDATSRVYSLLLIAITAAILLASFYFEFVLGLNPCPLCLMQRLCVMLMLPCTMISYYSKQEHFLRWALRIQLVVAGAGVFFAGRQVWLQLLPMEQVPVCLPGLKMMMHYLPWHEVVRTLFLGAGDCAETPWKWLGLSMPAWALLYFLGMFIATSVICHRQGRAI